MLLAQWRLLFPELNYGENVASCVTVSGTIGAAIEAAEKGLPTLAISQEISGLEYHDFSSKVDFSAAVHFTHEIAENMLNNTLPLDADVLKLEIPLGADHSTRCVLTRQDRMMYYKPVVKEREHPFNSPALVSYLPSKGEYSEKNTDAYAMAQGWVSITPLSFDLTSRGPLNELAELLNISSLDEDG